MIRRSVRSMSTCPDVFWAVAVLAAAMSGACTSASQARSLALEDGDVVERELDILHGCSRAAVEEGGLEIHREDSESRVLQTRWVGEGAERWRLTVLTRVHPRYGPGTDAVVTRDAWQGEGIGALDGPTDPDGAVESAGWVRVPGTPADDATAQGVTSSVRSCWARTSPLAE